MNTLCVVTLAFSLGLFLSAIYFYVLTRRLRRETQNHLDDAMAIHDSTQETLAEGERLNKSTVENLAKIETAKSDVKH